MDDLVQNAIKKLNKQPDNVINQIKTYAAITQIVEADINVFNIWLEAFVDAVLLLPYEQLVNERLVP